MYSLIIGLVLAVLVVIEIVFGQVWLRFLYVFRTTIYRDDNPVLYWLLVGVKAVLAVGLLGVGGMGLLK